MKKTRKIVKKEDIEKLIEESQPFYKFIKEALDRSKLEYTVIPTIYPLSKLEKNIKEDFSFYDSESDEVKHTVFNIDLEKNEYEVDEDFDISKINLCNIVIHYPELLLKNTSGKERLLRDIFVNLVFGSYHVELYGIRTTYTEEEAYSGYNHSHLSGFNSGFENFCLGRGPLASSRANQITSKEKATEFLINLRTYLQYESTRTRPYKYISDIIPINWSVVSPPVLYNISKCENLCNNVENIERYVYWDSGRYHLKINASFIAELNKANDKLKYKHQFFNKDGVIYQKLVSSEKIKNSSRIKDLEQRKPIWFNGREIPYKIIKENDVDESSLVLGFTLNELKNIKNYVEHKINAAASKN